MKKTKYTGTFMSVEGHVYDLTTSCFSFLQAFFLLTAKAIEMGRHYQLSSIVSESGEIRKIGDIMHCSRLIEEVVVA